MTPIEIQHSSSTSSDSSDESVFSFLSEMSSFRGDAGSTGVADRAVASQQEYRHIRPQRYEVGSRDSTPAEIDLCESDFTEVEVIDLLAAGSSRPAEPRRFPHAFGHPSVLGDFMRGESPIAESRMNEIFARIQDRIRVQAMMIDRLTAFQIDFRPRVAPSVILSSLGVRRLTCPAEAASLGACPICLETYRIRMSVRVLPGCGHLVHRTCMDKWISRSFKYTCPLDNIPIEPAEERSPVSASSAVEIAEAVFPRRDVRRSSRLRRRIE